MPGTIALSREGSSRKIARPSWIVSVAVAFAIGAPAGFAGQGQPVATDSVAVTVAARPGNLRVASTRTMGSAEMRIADFRYGAPRMGSTPRLPIPPPHRMRTGSAHPRI